MTSPDRLVELPTLAAPAPGSPLFLATEVLCQVRFPEAIFLRSIELDPEAGSAVGRFCCPRSRLFPNPGLGELTGGQLIDTATQMAYGLVGLMIHDGVDLLGLDFEGFKREIHAHRVHAVRSEATFRRPCRFDRPFTVEARLERFPGGAFAAARGAPRRHFVKIALRARQDAGEVFRARIAACRQAGPF